MRGNSDISSRAQSVVSVICNLNLNLDHGILCLQIASSTLKISRGLPWGTDECCPEEVCCIRRNPSDVGWQIVKYSHCTVGEKNSGFVEALRGLPQCFRKGSTRLEADDEGWDDRRN